jgi:hypothetical protein
MDPQSPHQRTLYRVMVLGTCLAFGSLGAIMVSMGNFVTGEAAFHFTVWSVVAFLAGAAVGWIFWQIIGRWQSRDRH